MSKMDRIGYILDKSTLNRLRFAYFVSYILLKWKYIILHYIF